MNAAVVIGRRPLIERDDQDDALWLTERLFTLGVGLQAARQAAIDIAENWTAGRCVGRLYSKKDAATFLIERFDGPLRLDKEGTRHLLVALVASGSSRRQAAKAAGVSEGSARNAVRKFTQPKALPTPGERIAKGIGAVLGTRSSLPAEFEMWLAAGPSPAERQAVAAAFAALIQRAQRWAERARQDA